MNTIKVLLVDDSLLARRLISNALNASGQVEVVGTAASGAAALAQLATGAPDAVILDYEMPGMNGAETLLKLREIYPALPVIVFSGASEHSARVTVDALAAGASDFVAKPTSSGPDLATIVESELAPRLSALCNRVSLRPIKELPDRNASARERLPTGALQVVVIASSTGGPNALANLLSHIPATIPVPILIAQHMPPVFTRCLAERLDSASPLIVREAQGGELLTAGSVWIAPGNYHLEIEAVPEGARTSLNQGPHENSCRPAADALFRSAASVFGPGVLGIVLTGMGHDGLSGAHAIVAANGAVLAQDEKSAVVWSMPKAIVEAGLADAVLSLEALADELLRRAARKRSILAERRLRP